ncbi:MAG: hypothetical protein ACREJM_13585, partial [Candidatus Saccharimonadales bacterium]
MQQHDPMVASPQMLRFVRQHVPQLNRIDGLAKPQRHNDHPPSEPEGQRDDDVCFRHQNVSANLVDHDGKSLQSRDS